MTIKLTPANLFAGRKKALQNANELFDDAKILFDTGRYARAFFLIQIATEELGKYGIMATSSISALHGSLDWKRFWQRFRGHKNKTEHLLLLEDLNQFISEKQKDLLNIEENKKYSSMQENVKMKSLYCDIIDGSEDFILPSQIISRKLCETALQLLENRIGLVTSFETEVASKFKLDKLRSEDIERFYDKVGLSKLLKRRTKP